MREVCVTEKSIVIVRTKYEYTERLTESSITFFTAIYTERAVTNRKYLLVSNTFFIKFLLKCRIKTI